MEEEYVHVVYIRADLSDEYNQHTAASMASVLDFCSKPVVFHIIHDEKKSENHMVELNKNKDLFNEFIRKSESKIEYHDANLPIGIEKCMNPESLKQFPRILLARIFLPELLPNINKVVSLGSDVIVKTDLAELIGLVSEDKSCAAAPDYWMLHVANNNLDVFNKPYRDYAHTLNIKLDKYVCADVMFLNLDYIRKKSLLPKLGLKYLNKDGELLLGDQDIFNAVLHDSIKILPTQFMLTPYNPFSSEEYVETAIRNSNVSNPQGYILHYAGGIKPWKGYYSKYDVEYWYYLSKTPWGENGKAFELMSHVLKTEYEILSTSPLQYIWSLPIKEKIPLLFNLSIGLWVGLFKQYWKRYITHEI